MTTNNAQGQTDWTALDDGCSCGLPPDAECHSPQSIGEAPCLCRPDQHLYGCQYLPWVMAQEEGAEDAVR